LKSIEIFGFWKDEKKKKKEVVVITVKMVGAYDGYNSCGIYNKAIIFKSSYCSTFESKSIGIRIYASIQKTTIES
jgi:hypothetical protein